MIETHEIQQCDDLVRTGSDGRLRYTREQRERVLDLFESSGMSGKAFAEKHGIKYPTFANWRKARRESEGASAGISSSGEAFVLAEVGTASKEGDALEVRLPGGARASAATPEQARLLAELLKHLTA